jgi:N-methylhydantoinase A
VPGPACYGRGGTEPTVTDAAFLLGMLGEGELAGDVRLDREAAKAAMVPLAEALGFTEQEVARGILTIANANMAGAIREITVEQGVDPRSAVLMPFGGAGPLFLSLLAEELELRTILLPPYAGNFSAWGLLGADLTQTVARTRVTALDDAGLAAANAVIDELYAEVGRRAAHAGSPGSVRETALDMRYVGQEHTLTVLAGDEQGRIADTPEQVRERFRAEYERTFGLRMDEAVEIVSLRATIRTPLPRLADAPGASSNGAAVTGGAAGSIRAYSFADEDWTEFAIVQRAGLDAGETIAGPAILLEETATAYIDRGFSGRVHESGSIVLTAEAKA